MPRVVFNKIHGKLMGKDPFIQKRGMFGRPRIHPLAKLAACLRLIAYGDAFDREDENLRLAGSTLKDWKKRTGVKLIAQLVKV